MVIGYGFEFQHIFYRSGPSLKHFFKLNFSSFTITLIEVVGIEMKWLDSQLVSCLQHNFKTISARFWTMYNGYIDKMLTIPIIIITFTGQYKRLNRYVTGWLPRETTIMYG